MSGSIIVQSQTNPGQAVLAVSFAAMKEEP